MTAFIRISSLSLVYPRSARGVFALDGIDLEVPRGQFLCVRGRSGSGKSSLLHVLAALRRPTAGSVHIADIDVGALPSAEAALYRRRQCGLVFQQFNLLEMLTAAENIGFPLAVDGMSPRRVEARIDPLLRELSLHELRDRYPSELSGGEQQRVAIARALAIQPKLVLADEPTGNLDSDSGARVWLALRELCKSHEVTVVMATHDPESEYYADRVVELFDGRTRADTSSADRSFEGDPSGR